MGVVNIKLNEADAARIGVKLENLLDPTVRLYMHHRLAAYCDPYVPKESGTLAQTTIATPEYLEYIQPYAHYQYEGIVYGPNFPIKEGDIVVGWYSIPGKKKHPTDRFLSHSKSVNPRAVPHWDKVAMAEHKEDFLGDVARYIAQRFNNGGD